MIKEIEGITAPDELRARRKELLGRIESMKATGHLNEFATDSTLQDQQDWEKEIKDIEAELQELKESLE